MRKKVLVAVISVIFLVFAVYSLFGKNNQTAFIVSSVLFLLIIFSKDILDFLRSSVRRFSATKSGIEIEMAERVDKVLEKKGLPEKERQEVIEQIGVDPYLLKLSKIHDENIAGLKNYLKIELSSVSAIIDKLRINYLVSNFSIFNVTSYKLIEEKVELSGGLNRIIELPKSDFHKEITIKKQSQAILEVERKLNQDGLTPYNWTQS